MTTLGYELASYTFSTPLSGVGRKRILWERGVDREEFKCKVYVLFMVAYIAIFWRQHRE